MNSLRVRSIAGVAAIALSLSACSTTSEGGPGHGWSIDSAAGRCAAAIVGGTLLGALAGAASGGGGKRVGRGATIGAVAGGGVCLVILAMDSRDKQRLKQAQIVAAKTGTVQYLAYSGNDGLSRKITVRPNTSAAADKIEKQAQSTIAAANTPICRTMESNVRIDTKGSINVPQQKLCRNSAGDWAPA